MSTLYQFLLLKISIMALFGSWKILQESNCQSKLHHLRIYEISHSLINNKESHFTQCGKVTNIKMGKLTMTINDQVEIKK